MDTNIYNKALEKAKAGRMSFDTFQCYIFPATMQWLKQGLTLEQIAKRLGKSKHYFNSWYKGYPQIKEAFKPYMPPITTRRKTSDEVILRMAERGLDNKDISISLGLSPNTISARLNRDRSLNNRVKEIRHRLFLEHAQDEPPQDEPPLDPPNSMHSTANRRILYG